MPDNSATLTGNLTADPKLEFTQSGYPRCTFRILVNRRFGEQTKTAGFNCVAWRELAEHVAESCSKGTRVMVSGYFEDRPWETDAGERRTTQQLVVEDLGVSLRFATAEVTKVARAGGQNGQTRGPSYGNGSAAARQAAKGTSAAPPAPPDPFSGEGPAEDPFGADGTSPF